MKLSEMTWPDVAALSKEIVVVFPIASLEQHSRHSVTSSRKHQTKNNLNRLSAKSQILFEQPP